MWETASQAAMVERLFFYKPLSQVENFSENFSEGKCSTCRNTPLNIIIGLTMRLIFESRLKRFAW